MSGPQLTLIVAYSENRVIGHDNALPWNLPGDLAHFKRATVGHPIVMGRKTWESLGRALPGRRNVVVTRNANYTAAGGEVVQSLGQALALFSDDETVFLIGGGELYTQGLSAASRVLATEVHAIVKGNVYFPSLPMEWKETRRSETYEENGLRYEFVVYERF